MTESIKIELSEEDVQRKTDSEKLSDLVKITFASHQLLSGHDLLLFGNGSEKGLCFKIDTQTTRLNWLIAILSVVGAAILGVIAKYFA
jgi:hypothetical protein